MLEKLINFFTQFLTQGERDRLSLKFEALESRMDNIEISQAEMKSKVSAIHEIWLANSELLEGKLNLSRANQEVIKDLIDTRFTFMDRSFNDLKDLIKSSGNQ